MLKLYKIYYNSGNYDGIQERCYIAKSEEEVKTNSEFYNKHKGGYGDLFISEESFDDYFSDPAPIENLYKYKLIVNVVEEKEI